MVTTWLGSFRSDLNILSITLDGCAPIGHWTPEYGHDIPVATIHVTAWVTTPPYLLHSTTLPLYWTIWMDFEELIASTIEQTKDIPEALSEAGKIGMPHGEIMRQIGQLFLLRMNINLVGNVLDAPVRYDFEDL
ncbi:hypothetical protein FRC12_007339 [Ceratobasidium sp. 428]|nr:hypothetical protein FRC12_007339 [Ceratobasidium sp. 428]